MSDESTSETLLAPTTSQDGELLVKDSRIKDVNAARQAYRRVKDADEKAAAERAKVQSVIDGKLPYNQSELDRNGLGQITNVNFGDAKRLVNMAVAPRIDLIESVETLCTMPTNFGDPQERPEWETIMAEEFTKLHRVDWPEFFPRYNYLQHQIVTHGVAVAYREDDTDWRSNVAPIGKFLIPRNTLASDEAIEIAFLPCSIPPHELYNKILNEDVAKEAGWNVEAVKESVKEACSSKAEISGSTSWEDVQKELKNNDLGVSNSEGASEIKGVYMWVKELDGRISAYLFNEKEGDDNDEDDGYLYEKRFRYETVNQAFQVFAFDIGTNGYYHSVRGMGSDIFAAASALNLLRCRFLDALMMQNLLMMEPESEESLEDLSLAIMGPFIIKPNGLKLVTKDSPNFNQSLIPGIQDLTNVLNNQAGAYTTEAAFNSTRERTRYEVQAQVESLANISISSLNLFYQPFERWLRETARRIINPLYLPEDPGGKAVMAFRQRCMERGVPEEAILMVDTSRIKATRAIGNGSAAARSTVMRQIMELSSRYDPQGQALVTRDVTMQIGGVALADRYAPKPESQRPPIDAQFAVLQNASLKLGIEIPVIPNELHQVQVPIHFTAEDEIIQSIDQGQIAIEEAMPQLVPIHTHIGEHLQYMQGDPAFPEYKARFQRNSEVITNGIKRMEKIQREQAAAQGQGQPAAEPLPGQPVSENGDTPATLAAQLVEARTRLQIEEEKHQQAMRQKEESHSQAMALKDAETAAKINRDNISKTTTI